MARPKKDAKNLRIKTMRVRVTEDEEKQILLNSRMAGYSTTSDFYRNLALGVKPSRRSVNTDQELLIRIKGEIGKLGSNINQIARALNRRQESEQLTNVSETEINNAMSGVDTLTRHLLEILGYGH